MKRYECSLALISYCIGKKKWPGERVNLAEMELGQWYIWPEDSGVIVYITEETAISRVVKPYIDQAKKISDKVQVVIDILNSILKETGETV